jgi:hypothetical protein
MDQDVYTPTSLVMTTGCKVGYLINPSVISARL